MISRRIIIAALMLAGAPDIAGAADADDAKAAAVGFLHALSTNDTAFVDAHFAGGAAEQKLLGIFRHLIQENIGLRNACIRSFGAEAVKTGISMFDPATMAGQVEKFDVDITGDTARVHRPKTDGDHLVLKKVDGIWKISSLTGTPGNTAQAIAFLVNFTPVLLEVRKEVEAGQYSSISQVQAALSAKRLAAMKAWVFRQTAAATQPTTQPAQ